MQNVCHYRCRNQSYVLCVSRSDCRHNPTCHLAQPQLLPGYIPGSQRPASLHSRLRLARTLTAFCDKMLSPSSGSGVSLETCENGTSRWRHRKDSTTHTVFCPSWERSHMMQLAVHDWTQMCKYPAVLLYHPVTKQTTRKPNKTCLKHRLGDAVNT